MLEIGCGPLGGFVPELRSSGYDVVGVDPHAPDEDDYRRGEIEKVDPLGRFEVVIASTALHHVAVPSEAIARVVDVLTREGTLIVIEWSWEEFDEPTARWCFQRLAPDEDAGWLHRRRDEWTGGGQEWETYLRTWAAKERLHTAAGVLQLLDQHFNCQHVARGPYFFPDLADTTEHDELQAIEAGQIRATRIDYVGTLRPSGRA